MQVAWRTCELMDHECHVYPVFKSVLGHVCRTCCILTIQGYKYHMWLCFFLACSLFSFLFLGIFFICKSIWFSVFLFGYSALWFKLNPPPPPPPKLKPLVVCWIVIFCVVTPWNLVDSFRGACCLCLQDRRTVLSDEGTGFSKLLFLIYQSSCYHIQEDSDVITIVCCLCFPASLYSVYDVWINRITVHIFVCFMVQVEVFDIVKMGQQRVYWHHL